MLGQCGGGARVPEVIGWTGCAAGVYRSLSCRVVEEKGVLWNWVAIAMEDAANSGF